MTWGLETNCTHVYLNNHTKDPEQSGACSSPPDMSLCRTALTPQGRTTWQREGAGLQREALEGLRHTGLKVEEVTVCAVPQRGVATLARDNSGARSSPSRSSGSCSSITPCPTVKNEAEHRHSNPLLDGCSREGHQSSFIFTGNDLLIYMLFTSSGEGTGINLLPSPDPLCL